MLDRLNRRRDLRDAGASPRRRTRSPRAPDAPRDGRAGHRRVGVGHLHRVCRRAVVAGAAAAAAWGPVDWRALLARCRVAPAGSLSSGGPRAVCRCRARRARAGSRARAGGRRAAARRAGRPRPRPADRSAEADADRLRGEIQRQLVALSALDSRTRRGYAHAMKCPKCGYLGFEPVDRCRNCGYDFSLAAAPGCRFANCRFASSRPRPRRPGRPMRQPCRRPSRPPSRCLARRSPTTRRSSPRRRRRGRRSPCAARRPRCRAEAMAPRTATLDLALEAPPQDPGELAGAADAGERAGCGRGRITVAARPKMPRSAPACRRRPRRPDSRRHRRRRRLLHDADLRPRLRRTRRPAQGAAAAFLVLQNGGYLVAFHRRRPDAGQDGRRHQGRAADSTSPLDLGRAFVRELMWLVLAVPAGLGFLTRRLQPRSPRPARSLRRHPRRPRLRVIDVSSPRASRPRLASAMRPSRPARSAPRPAFLLWAVLPGPPSCRPPRSS